MKPRNINMVVRFHQEYFETRFPFDARRAPVWKQVAAYIQQQFIPDNASILDLGAGYCDFINNVRGSSRCAVDIFQRLAEFAGPGVDAKLGNCTDMSFFEDNRFDVVFASNLLEHLTHEELLDTLAEVKRVLKPGGRFIILQPNFKYCYKTYFDDYTHLQIFTHNGIYDLFEAAGLKIDAAFPKFLPVNMKSTLKLRIPFLAFWVWLYLRFPVKPMAGQMLVVAMKPGK